MDNIINDPVEITELDLALKAEREIAEQIFEIKTNKPSSEYFREKEIRSIAKSLFITFFDSEDRDEVFFGPGARTDIVEEYCDKAEKIHNFFGSFESSHKLIEFLQIVDPQIARQIIEKL